MKKSICIVVQSVYDFDPRVRRKAEALVAAGYAVDVMALQPADGQSTYTLNGVNVHTLSVGKKRGSLARYFFEYGVFFLWVFFRLPLLMRRRRYEVIDVNTLPDFLVFAPLIARLMGARIVLDMHEITPEFYMSKFKIDERSWTIRILTFLEKISFDFADHVITINEPILDLLVSRGLAREKTTVIMNAADEARFSAKTKAAGVPAAAGKAFVMVYHGTLTPIYGLDIAVEAFALARRDMPGAELWILGSGTEQQPLAALAAERGVDAEVRLFGQVPASDIPAWLEQTHVGILPIRKDVFLDFAFPNKLPEFIITGKPVVISRLKAIRHYFSDEALAYFEPHNPADLAAQMVRLYRDEALRARLVARAKVEYTGIRWEVMKERYLSLMDGLTGVTSRRAADRTAAVANPFEA
jgi:glycosyltransferase involved in cell wall biosynthesis